MLKSPTRPQLYLKMPRQNSPKRFFRFGFVSSMISTSRLRTLLHSEIAASCLSANEARSPTLTIPAGLGRMQSARKL